MIMQQTLDALEPHLLQARAKHAPFAQGPPVLIAIRARADKLEAAIGSTADPDHLAEIGRRLIQTAVIALRAYEDLGVTASPPKDAKE